MRVSTTISLSGIEERAPETDEEWDAVGASAAALIESANLLMMDGRAVDRDQWMTMTRAMRDSSRIVLEAVEARSADDLLASGEALNESCDSCHRRYQLGAS